MKPNMAAKARGQVMAKIDRTPWDRLPTGQGSVPSASLRSPGADWRSRLTWIFAILILVPSMLGFGAKFVEFVRTFRSTSDGIFAITPIINYILASLGFLCLLTWAAANGMFRDIERPKHRMLDEQLELDQRRLDERAEAAETQLPGSGWSARR